MSLIMGDYVAGFLGLSEGNAWNLDAFDVRFQSLNFYPLSLIPLAVIANQRQGRYRSSKRSRKSLQCRV